MIDVGTLGSTPSQVSLNSILIELGDSKITSIVTSRFQKAKGDLANLKKYLQNQNVKFYSQMLELVRLHHMEAVRKGIDGPNKLPPAVVTHWHCVMTGLFRQARREIAEAVKENVRRRQRGQLPL